MKVRSYVYLASALGFLGGCGTSGNTPAPAVQVDQNTPVVTTGAKCAAASMAIFTPAGKKVGVSQIQPGTYTYAESKHIYIGENKADGAVVEGFATDHPKDASSDKDFVSNMDCQSSNGLKAGKTYSDVLAFDFPEKMVINKGGDLSEPSRRFVTVVETQGQFAVNGNLVTVNKTVSNAELKSYDAKYSTTANRKREYWQDDNGDLYLVLHSGVNLTGANIGASKVTRDSIVHYKRTDSN